jgi:hypothetical protein
MLPHITQDQVTWEWEVINCNIDGLFPCNRDVTWEHGNKNMGHGNNLIRRIK